MNDNQAGKRDSLLDGPTESNAVVHFYRALVTRSNAWRRIIDNTTNWAVAATAAMFSFGFSGREAGHVVLFLAHFLILMFLMIEARRYCFYTAIDWRVRLLETEFFAHILAGDRETAGRGNWRDKLAKYVVTPYQPLSIREALSLRLSRTYIWVFLLLSVAWLIRIASYPETVSSLSQLSAQSGFRFVPGWVTWLILLGLYSLLGGAILSLQKTKRRLDREGFSLGQRD